MATAESRVEADHSVEDRVIDVVAAVLDLPREKINVKSSLEGDLGAESLDYLDMAFSLEREFNILFPRVDVLQRALGHFGEEKLWANGKFTEFGAELLKQSMPELDAGLSVRDMGVADLRRMFVVGTLVRVVNRLLAAKAQLPRECPACQGHLKEMPSSPELRCESCQHSVPIPSGDDIMTADLLAIGTRLSS